MESTNGSAASVSSLGPQGRAGRFILINVHGILGFIPQELDAVEIQCSVTDRAA